jgi:hypothetical protein
VRAYLVSTAGGLRKYAGTQAEVAATKRAWLEDGTLKRKEISVQEVEVPTAKAELIAFINGLLE